MAIKKETLVRTSISLPAWLYAEMVMRARNKAQSMSAYVRELALAQLKERADV